MSKEWLDSTLAAILTIVKGNAGDPETKAKVAELAAKIATDEGNAAATNAEFQTAITAIVNQLAAAPPPTGPVPVVVSLSASSGSIAGGESVTINGTDLTGATVVNFGAVAAADLVVANPTAITVTAPPQAAGIIDVTVTTPGGVSLISPASKYTYA